MFQSEKPNAHSDIIRSVKFNHDGTKIVSGSDDRTLKVWDAGARFLCLTSGPSAAIGTRVVQREYGRAPLIRPTF